MTTPLLDGRRVFFGKPQSSDYENRILARIAAGTPLVAVCETRRQRPTTSATSRSGGRRRDG
jgi:hypothetical protein